MIVLVVLILTWIGVGMAGFDWLTRTETKHPSLLIGIGVLVYFGVPMIAVAILAG